MPCCGQMFSITGELGTADTCRTSLCWSFLHWYFWTRLTEAKLDFHSAGAFSPKSITGRGSPKKGVLPLLWTGDLKLCTNQFETCTGNDFSLDNICLSEEDGLEVGHLNRQPWHGASEQVFDLGVGNLTTTKVKNSNARGFAGARGGCEVWDR